MTDTKIARTVADATIAELKTRPDIVTELQKPGADFVWIEEGLSSEIHNKIDADGDEWGTYLDAFGYVMTEVASWGITPPIWFLRERPRRTDVDALCRQFDENKNNVADNLREMDVEDLASAYGLSLDAARHVFDHAHQTITIRVATVPFGASPAIVHPACVSANFDRDEVEYHDLTVADLRDQDIVACDVCGEPFVVPSSSINKDSSHD